MKSFVLIQLLKMIELATEVLAAITRHGCEGKTAHETIIRKIDHMAQSQADIKAKIDVLVADEAKLISLVGTLHDQSDANAALKQQVADLQAQIAAGQPVDLTDLGNQLDAADVNLKTALASLVPADPAPPVVTDPAPPADPAPVDPTQTA
jgi:flagellar hook-basal body complex protein FliE